MPKPFLWLLRIVWAAHVIVYLGSGGLIGQRLGGVPFLLLTTRGRRSGRSWTRPLTFVSDGDSLVVAASYGGSPRHPAWYLNLAADPTVEVQIGRRTFRTRARLANPDERARLWPRFVATYRGFADYQRRTDRQIPLVVLPRPTRAAAPPC